jgi:hypothetical protein
MTKLTTRADALRAGRLIMAVGMDDWPQISAVFREAAAEPSGVMNLCLELASTAIGAATAACGDDWPAVLSHSMLDVELDAALDEGEAGE